MALSFAFDTSKGETPESVRRKRDMIRSLLGAQRAPQNVGEGLNALGDGIVAAILDGRADKAESAGLASANSVFGTLTGGGGAFPTAPGGQSTPFDGDLRSGILSSAEALGIDPVDLATAISYETGGTMDPLKYGPTTQWGRHRGLIQFGEPQAAENGVDWNNPLGSQLGPEGAVVKYLRSAGVKPGMGLLDVYSAINAGAPGLYDRTDENNGGAPGTVRDKVEKQMGSHRAKALALMGGQNQVASLDPSIGLPPAPGTPPASAGTAPAIDPYSKIPALDGRGEDQRAKFRMWNPDPIGGEGANLAAVDPALRKVIERAKQLTDQRFVLGSGKRSQELQKKAVEWGWSKTLDSDHAGGGATDLWPLDEDGAVVFDKARQAKIVEAMDKASRELGVDLDAGARWRSFKDRPHFAVIGQTPMEGPIPQARPGTQVASLDPSAGLADAQGGAVEAPPPPGVQIAQALSGTPEMAGNAPSGRRQPSIPELLGGLGNGWMSPAQQKILGVMLEQQMRREDPAYQMGLEKTRTELDLLKNPRLSPYEAQQIELAKRKATLEEEATRLDIELKRNPQMTPYERAQIEQRKAELAAEHGKLVNVPAGTTVFDPTTRQPVFTAPEKNDRPWWANPDGSVDPAQIRNQEAGRTSINNVVGGEPGDGELRKSLDKGEGEQWAAYKQQGATSGAMAQDFQILDELMKVAPQGILSGRLAEMFPGVSSAGDAFQSIVTRIAPTLRAPGSGATSDIEYEGMLRSLPRLRNQPEANAMIGSIMKAKAALNVQRSEVITKYQTGDISAAEARRQMADLDKQSIVTPEMKRALVGIGGEAEPTPTGDGKRLRFNPETGELE